MRTPACLILSVLAAAPALAQSSISTTNKYCWNENTGFLNWRDANGSAEGVRVGPAGLSGYIWSENAGWISVGSSGGPYANTNNTNFGINLDGSHQLSGMAWGENIGWINFSAGSTATPPNPARIDPAANRLRGYAWAENTGWINLDDASIFIGLGCYANCDSSTAAPVLNVNDFTCFLNKFAAADPYANCDGSTTPPVLNVNDFTCFLNKFAAGCS